MICPNPITVRKGQSNEAVVPCGKCYYCLQNYRNMWITRLKAEYLSCMNGQFVTLTYDDEHLPIQELVNSNTGEIVTKQYPDKVGFQKFLKRLRKKYELRYFAVPEYGDLSQRVHWHALFFLQFVPDAKFYDDVERAWGNGYVQFGEVTDASITYVTKYLLKDSNVPYGILDNKMLCSRNPPIGSEVIMKFKDYAVKSGNYTQLSFSGYRASTPRLYRDKFRSGIEVDYTDQIQRSLALRDKMLKEEFERSSFRNFQEFLVWKLETEREIRLKNHKKHNNL